jgi:hypothetical protein
VCSKRSEVLLASYQSGPHRRKKKKPPSLFFRAVLLLHQLGGMIGAAGLSVVLAACLASAANMNGDYVIANPNLASGVSVSAPDRS